MNVFKFNKTLHFTETKNYHLSKKKKMILTKKKRGDRTPCYSAHQTEEDFDSTHHLTKRSPKRQVNTSLVGSILGLMYWEYD